MTLEQVNTFGPVCPLKPGVPGKPISPCETPKIDLIQFFEHFDKLEIKIADIQSYRRSRRSFEAL